VTHPKQSIHLSWRKCSRAVCKGALGVALASGALLPPSAEAAISFRNDIVPALTKLGCNSGSCHGSQYGKGGFKLSLLGFDPEADYDAIVKDLKGRRVNLTEPAASLFLRKPSLALPHGGGKRFAAGSATYNSLLGWLAAGVPPPLPTDPMLAGVVADPGGRTLEAGTSLPVRISARFSDGSSRDVTDSCRLEALDERIVEVSREGVVTAKSGGQTAVLARYMGKTALVHFVVPFGKAPASNEFPIRNRVDELVAAKWRQLGLRPARLSTDMQFLRRVYLDLIGILPSEEEVREFTADPSPEKRTRLIDDLLERPEYADFWALRWGDLLRVTRNGMGEKAMWNFNRWLRRSLQSNRPVNEMVREILLSRGQPNSQDVAAFYRMTRTPEEAAEAVAVGFMGLRIGCAKCHQHPFEKWGQADYYGLAAFFARIDSKPDSDFGAQTLRLKPAGVVRHPKTQEAVPPRAPGGDAFPYDGDPRVHLADWLTAPDNAWFARNFANRFWGYLLGRGLVEPLDDLRDTNPPSIPELLDALAAEFRDSGYDQKHLLRLIANSSVYQLDSQPAPDSPQDSIFYSYLAPKRLTAEQLLDAINTVTHVQDEYRNLPRDIRPIQLPDPEVQSDFLDIFGRPRRLVPCECSRSNDTNITQVLHLMNSDYIQQKIEAPGGRIASLFGLVPPAQIVSNLYYAALGRPPSEDELTQAKALIEQRPAGAARQQVLEDLLWVILNSREFLFNH
jgi:hypothetical protein